MHQPMPPLNPFLAACSNTPLRTAMAAHGATVVRSYAETKIESYEQKEMAMQDGPLPPTSAGFIRRSTSEQR